MSERRVRQAGRPMYGRAAGLSRPIRKRRPTPKLTSLQKRILAAVIVVLAVGWGIGKWFELREVKVVAPSRQAEIKAVAEKALEGSIRQGNLLTLDSEAFVSELQQSDPGLKTVKVKRDWPRTLIVEISLKQPSLAWVTGNQTYVLDRDGTVIGTLSGAAAFPVVHDGSNVPVQPGQRAAATSFVTFVTEVMPELSKLGITVTRLDIKDTTLDLTAHTNKGYRILFDTSRGAREEVTDLKSVLALLATQKRTPAEYIDLRIAGKAYYK